MMQTYSQPETNFLFDRIEELKSKGIAPYTKQFARSMKLYEVNEDHEAVGYEYEGATVTLRLAGRVMNINPVSEDWILVTIEDQDSRLQLSLEAERIGKTRLDDFRHLVFRGDYLGFEVDYIYRERGDVTASVSEWCFLALCFLPLPRTLHDQERQRRQRFVHYALSIDARQHFLMRSKIAQYVRCFLAEREFAEGFSHLLYPMNGASDVDASAKQHTLFNEKLASHLRHYLVGGIEQVYEITANRQAGNVEGVDHPQVQIMQCCMMLTNLDEAMRFVEQLISSTVKHFNSVFAVPWVSLEEITLSSSEFRLDPNASQSLEIDFTPVWPRLHVEQLVQMVSGEFFPGMSLEEAVNVAVEAGMPYSELEKLTAVEDVYWAVVHHFVGSTLVQPTFAICPACGEGVDRFELYVNGIKFAEGYSRTGNPMADGFRNASPDDQSLTALKYGMPPSAELAVSIDHLTMALLGAQDIRDVIPFPETHL